ncbi:hypothetical protein ACFVAV_13790 [Nocardia sp. NPDC057663]|uniref:hypothetical protein n=1 Tax=Nocardia sp. NPDC057663 TaxID=3346201 RepID=UPI00366FFF15
MAEPGTVPPDTARTDRRPTARFGAEPLAQTVAAAATLRRVIGLLLALEHPHPTVDAMLSELSGRERELAAAVPPDPAPRFAGDPTDRRVYLNHAFDIGAFNPCFPEYVFDHLDTTTARGRITFPLVHEGPPGLAHGGFLGVFFDAVVQHHSCASGVAGKTRSMEVTYRRPTPILTELDFDIVRVLSDHEIESTARILRDGQLLCSAVVRTVAVPIDGLPTARFGPRTTRP